MISDTLQRARQREELAAVERCSGNRPQSEVVLSSWDFEAREGDKHQCEKHQFGFWTYHRWRHRSTLSMLATALLHLLLVLIRLAEHFFDESLEDRSTILFSGHIVISVLMLCAAVTGQTLLFFRKSSAYPAYIGTIGNSLLFAASLYILVGLAENPQPREIEACFVVSALTHCHGMSITSLDREIVTVLIAVLGWITLIGVDGAGYQNGLRILGSLICILVGCGIEHYQLCKVYLAEHSLIRDVTSLTEELQLGEDLVGNLYPIALHKQLDKAQEDPLYLTGSLTLTLTLTLIGGSSLPHRWSGRIDVCHGG